MHAMWGKGPQCWIRYTQQRRLCRRAVLACCWLVAAGVPTPALGPRWGRAEAALLAGEEVIAVMRKGADNRRLGETNMNRCAPGPVCARQVSARCSPAVEGAAGARSVRKHTLSAGQHAHRRACARAKPQLRPGGRAAGAADTLHLLRCISGAAGLVRSWVHRKATTGAADMLHALRCAGSAAGRQQDSVAPWRRLQGAPTCCAFCAGRVAGRMRCSPAPWRPPLARSLA